MNIDTFLRKRKIRQTLHNARLKLFKAVSWFFKLAFTKRTLLFVTNEKIRSITLGPLTQFCVFLFIAWVANLFYQSLQYDKILSAKSKEITRLENVNYYFETEFSNINEKLKKVNDYLVSVTGHTNLVGEKKKPPLVMPQKFQEDDLSKSDKHTLNEIKNAAYAFQDMEEVVDERIKRIEKTIAITGLSVKRPNNPTIARHAPIIGAQGGPLVPEVKNFIEAKNLETDKFVNEMERLIVLEKLTKVIPLARPIKSYYVTSGFGRRVDPITGGYATHQGLDFAGPEREKILSPSSGKVILAGQFSGYGNAVVIDHGFGITTRYGHLSVVKVQKGQIVKKGDVIALQGNTGRSTGPHLHYEVRYKNIPLNPRKFLEAGDSLNSSNSFKYANS